MQLVCRIVYSSTFNARKSLAIDLAATFLNFVTKISNVLSTRNGRHFASVALVGLVCCYLVVAAPNALAGDNDQASAPTLLSEQLDDIWTIYTRAKTYDAAFQQALNRKLAEQEVLEQAQSQLLPSITANYSKTRSHQRIKSSDNIVFRSGSAEYDSKTYGISLTQPIFNAEAIRGKEKAEREVLKTNIDFASAQQDLILRVAERYLTVLAAQDNLDFSNKEEQAVKAQADVAKARFKARLGREADYLEAKARYSSVYSARIAAENLLDDTYEGIREISGQKAFNVKRLNEQVTLMPANPDDLEIWRQRARSGNLKIVSQRYALEASALEIKRQNAGHFPKVNLVGGWRNEDQEGSLFGGGSDVVSADISLQFSMDLYKGGQTRSQVRQARKLHQVEQEKLNEVLRSVERETRAAFLELKSAMLKIEALDEAVSAQHVVVETKRKGYPRLYTSKDVLDSERDFYAAKRDWAKARYDYLLASLRLKLAEGSLNDDDLLAINTLFEKS